MDNNLPDAQHFVVKGTKEYYKDIVSFLSTKMQAEGYFKEQKKQLVVKAAYFQLITVELYKMGPDEILQKCLLKHQRPLVLDKAHDGIVGGHYRGKGTAQKILQFGLWWSTLTQIQLNIARVAIGKSSR